jgi:hypothetical protein
MGIGLLLGRDGPQGDKEPAYAEARRFYEAFSRSFSSTACPDLIGFDLGTLPGRAAARASGAHGKKCVPLVAWSAAYLADLLGKMGTDPSSDGR